MSIAYRLKQIHMERILGKQDYDKLNGIITGEVDGNRIVAWRALDTCDVDLARDVLLGLYDSNLCGIHVFCDPVILSSNVDEVKRDKLVRRLVELGLSEADANDCVASLTSQDIDRMQASDDLLPLLGLARVDEELAEGDSFVERGEREHRTLYNLVNAAFNGNADALNNLRELARGGWRVSGAAQEILSNWDLLMRAYQVSDPQEVGVYLYRLYNATAGRVIECIQNSGDRENLSVYLHNMNEGPVSILREMFRQRSWEYLAQYSGEDYDRELDVLVRLGHDVLSYYVTSLPQGGVENLANLSERVRAIALLASFADLDSRNVKNYSVGAVLSEVVSWLLPSDEISLISISLPDNLVFAERVDVVQWAYILYELVRNADKYRDETKPELNITISWDENQKAFVVEDDGIGIENVDAVWGSGVREGRAKGVSGRGLGLASIRERVEKLGWEIELESEVGKWTRFRIYPKDGDVVSQ